MEELRKLECRCGTFVPTDYTVSSVETYVEAVYCGKGEHWDGEDFMCPFLAVRPRKEDALKLFVGAVNVLLALDADAAAPVRKMMCRAGDPLSFSVQDDGESVMLALSTSKDVAHEQMVFALEDVLGDGSHARWDVVIHKILERFERGGWHSRHVMSDRRAAVAAAQTEIDMGLGDEDDVGSDDPAKPLLDELRAVVKRISSDPECTAYTSYIANPEL